MPPHAIDFDQYDPHHYTDGGGVVVGGTSNVQQHNYYLHPRAKPDLLFVSSNEGAAALATQQQQPKPKRRVSFARTKKVYKAPRRHAGIATSDKWYSEQDIQNHLQHCMDTIAWITSIPKGCGGGKQRKEALRRHERSFTMRGLEELTPGGMRRKVTNVHESVSAVLQEQARQRAIAGVMTQPEWIAEVYFQATHSCLERFFTRALKDCMEVYPEYKLLAKQQQNQSRTKSTSHHQHSSCGKQQQLYFQSSPPKFHRSQLLRTY